MDLAVGQPSRKRRLLGRSHSRGTTPRVEHQTMKQSVLIYFALLGIAAALVNGQATQRTGQTTLQNQSPKATITGTVTRTDNGQPIKGARVMLQSGTRTQAALTAGIAVVEPAILANLISS